MVRTLFSFICSAVFSSALMWMTVVTGNNQSMNRHRKFEIAIVRFKLNHKEEPPGLEYYWNERRSIANDLNKSFP